MIIAHSSNTMLRLSKNSLLVTLCSIFWTLPISLPSLCWVGRSHLEEQEKTSYCILLKWSSICLRKCWKVKARHYLQHFSHSNYLQSQDQSNCRYKRPDELPFHWTDLLGFTELKQHGSGEFNSFDVLSLSRHSTATLWESKGNNKFRFHLIL